MSKFRCKYEYTNEFGHARHIWSCIGRHGAMHFHVTDMGEGWAKTHAGDRYGGGLEVHYRQPPDYMADKAPSQDRCWLLNQPCWHDGTSLYASDYLIPRWREDPNNHERMFIILQDEYQKRFGESLEAKAA